MSDSREIHRDPADMDDEPIIKELVRMARSLKDEEIAERIRLGREFPEFPYIPEFTFFVPAEGTPMHTLTRVVEEFLYPLRKEYGAWGRVSISIASVSRDKISVIIEGDRAGSEEEELVLGIRNGFLHYLRDMVPSAFFQGIYYNRSRSRFPSEHFLTFYEEEDIHEFPKGLVMPGEEDLGPERERVRPLVKELWEKI